MIKNCKFCGKEFSTVRKSTKCCSFSCAAKYRAKKRWHGSGFPSLESFYTGVVRKEDNLFVVDKECPVCGCNFTVPFKNRRFTHCSNHCSAKNKWSIGVYSDKLLFDGDDTHLTQEQAKRRRSRKDHKDWSFAVYKRDNFTCNICGKRGGVLHAHHILKFTKFKDFRYLIDNGVCLCASCHRSLEAGLRMGSEKAFIITKVIGFRMSRFLRDCFDLRKVLKNDRSRVNLISSVSQQCDNENRVNCWKAKDDNLCQSAAKPSERHESTKEGSETSGMSSLYNNSCHECPTPSIWAMI